MVKMLIGDIEITNKMLIIKIPDSKTNKPRQFVIPDSQNYIALFKKYIELRSPKTPHQRLFVCYRSGKCTVQPVGIHTFGQIPCKVASFLGLPNSHEYTGHCWRRTSATLLVDAGGDLTCLKRHGGWRSSSVAEGYIEESLQEKVKVAKRIHGNENESMQTLDVVGAAASTSTEKNEKMEIAVPSTSGLSNMLLNKKDFSGINLSNIQNSSININITCEK